MQGSALENFTTIRLHLWPAFRGVCAQFDASHTVFLKLHDKWALSAAMLKSISSIVESEVHECIVLY